MKMPPLATKGSSRRWKVQTLEEKMERYSRRIEESTQSLAQLEPDNVAPQGENSALEEARNGSEVELEFDPCKH